MKILVTGANGLLGQKLVLLMAQKAHIETIATGRGEDRLKAEGYTYHSMDITNKENVAAVFNDTKPDVVINTAAMTNVDACEKDRELCWDMNVNGVQHIIDAAADCGAFLLHVSTDFIFDGSEGPLAEDATPAPVNYYGESKLEAEKRVQDSNIDWAIARTVLVYGITQNMSRSNIILWVKSSLEGKKDIKVVDDQWRTPTLAEDLAMGCFLIADKQAKGVFNISGKDFLSPYDMAIKTADFFGLDKSHIERTDSTMFTQPAKRPPKTGFVIDKAVNELGYAPHSFDEGLAVLQGQLGMLQGA